MNTDKYKSYYKQGFFPRYIESVLCSKKIGRLCSGDICFNEKGTLFKLNNFNKKIKLTQEEADYCYIIKTNFEMEVRDRLINIEKKLNSLINC